MKVIDITDNGVDVKEHARFWGRRKADGLPDVETIPTGIERGIDLINEKIIPGYKRFLKFKLIKDILTGGGKKETPNPKEVKKD